MGKSARVNPFQTYQQQRVKQNREKVIKAIETLKSMKVPISYSAVAKLSGLTTSGIIKNSEYVALIESARSQVSPHIKDSDNAEFENPKTIDDALAIVRILRAKNRALSNKLKVQAMVIKKYDIHYDGKDFAAAIESGRNVVPLNQSAVFRKIVRAILDDKVYQLGERGISNGLGELVVPIQLLKDAGVLE